MAGYSVWHYSRLFLQVTDLIKIYDKSLPTTRFFVDRIDLYMPVLDWLSKSAALSGRILTPVPLLNGEFRADTDDDFYVVFLYVHGEVPGINDITRKQTIELAETLALLHETGKDIPFESPVLVEDISLSFCCDLARFIVSMSSEHEALKAIVSPDADMLRTAIGECLSLRDTRRSGYYPIVLCHGDAHGNNVIQSEQLVLTDWEDLRYAPAEADLFIYAWHPFGNELLRAYSETRHGYSVNQELLRFYVLRRRIEDVWVDIQRLTQESPDESETAKLHGWIRQGVDEIRAILQ